MKHVRNFENFKKNRAHQQTLESADNNYYYNKGKSYSRSIFEMEMIKEGFSETSISMLNEGYSLKKIDHKIIDCVYEYFKTGAETGIELLTEELTVAGYKIPSFADMYKGASNVIDKGIQFGKTVVKNFSDFLKNIGNIVKNLFSKIKTFFMKVWEIFKPKIVAAMGFIKKTVMGATPGDKMKNAADKLKSDAGINEMNVLSEDLKKVCAKFSSGNIGNMSEESARHLEGEAAEYEDIEGDPEIEQLMQESLERKGSVGKIFYSIKGYLLEGGSIEELDSVFEAEEVKVEFKEGDEVTYKNKEGKEGNSS